MRGPLASFTVKIPRNQTGGIRLTLPKEIRKRIGIVTYREHGKKYPKSKTPILFIDVNATKSISPVYLYRGQITIRGNSLAKGTDTIRVNVIQVKSLIDSTFRTNERITEKNGKKFLDLYALIPPFTSGSKGRYPIIVFNCADSLTMSYKTPSASPASVTIPRYLPFDQWTCRVFGLYITDVCTIEKRACFRANEQQSYHPELVFRFS